MIALLFLLLLALFPAQVSAALPAGCEQEVGLVGRTDIISCQPWESTSWWSDGTWWEDGGDPTPVPTGRVYTHPALSSDVTQTEIATSGCISGNCLKVNFRAWNNGYSATSLYNVIPGIGGCSHDTGTCVPQQELWMRYYMKLSPNFDSEGASGVDGTPQGSISGGKFAGLGDPLNGGHSQCGNGGAGPDAGTECWTTRLTFQPCIALQQNGFSTNPCADAGNPTSKTRIGFYPYLYNGNPGGTRFATAFWDNDGRESPDGPCTVANGSFVGAYGLGGGLYGAASNTPPFCGSGAAGILTDKWYLVEVHIKMNDPGTNNGILEGWLDGVLRYQKTNVNYRNPGHNNLGIRTFWFDIFQGGTGIAPKADEAWYFDQMVIASGGRIGPVNGNLMAPVALTQWPVIPYGGFNRGHFLSSIGCYFVMLQGGSVESGDNSGICYNPLTGVPTTLFPSDASTGDISHTSISAGRDNFISFYIPWRDEWWISGGSHVELSDKPQDYIVSAILSFANCHPMLANCAHYTAMSNHGVFPFYVGENWNAAFAGIVKNPQFGHWATDNASACNSVAQKCMFGFGFTNFDAHHYLLENNVDHSSGSLCNAGSATGAEPMINCELPNNPKNIPDAPDLSDQPAGGGTTPGYRSQVMNSLTEGPSATQCFYLTGGYAGIRDPISGQERSIRDLWVFNCTTGAWTQLTSPPSSTDYREYYTPFMVYDSFRNQLLLQTYNHLYAYSITNAVWTDVTPAGGMGFVSINSYGAYMPPPYGDVWIIQEGDLKDDPSGQEAAHGLRGFTQSGGLPVNNNAVVNVASSPTSGATIAVSPPDLNGQSDGTTAFSRSYGGSANTMGTLTAPATFGGNPFADWSGPCDSVSTTVCHFTATGNRSFTAVYTAVSANYDLTITSVGGDPVTMTVTPDLSSTSSCSTPCTLSYKSGTSVVATAPLTNGTASYTLWSAGCTSLAGNVCTVSMTGAKTVTATYSMGSTYQASVDFSNVQGQRNWTYRTGAGSSMTFVNGHWQGGQSFQWILPGGAMHPGLSDTSVRRWTAPVTQNIRVAGSAFDSSGVCPGSDGVGITIKKNTTTLINFALAHGDTMGQAFNLTTNVIAGDTIDFIVDSGPSGSNLCDTTSFDAVIGPAQTIQVFFGAGHKLGIGSSLVGTH